MTVEKEYYENPEFWTDEAFGPRDRQRIEAVAGLVPSGTTSLLDVGCGNGLFVRYLRQSRRDMSTIHAVDRSQAALAHVQPPVTVASIEQLPFPDRAFDVVAALEVIEHLPATVYRRGLSELCRVAGKFVLISVPNRQNLEEGLVQCCECRSCFHPDYHLRSFNEHTLGSLLLSYGFVSETVAGVGEKTRLRGTPLITRFTGRRLGGAHGFASAIPCPVCGALMPPSSQVPTDGLGEGRPQGRTMRLLIKKHWPKVTEPSWICGLFRRSGL